MLSRKYCTPKYYPTKYFMVRPANIGQYTYVASGYFVAAGAAVSNKLRNYVASGAIIADGLAGYQFTEGGAEWPVTYYYEATGYAVIAGAAVVSKITGLYKKPYYTDPRWFTYKKKPNLLFVAQPNQTVFVAHARSYTFMASLPPSIPEKQTVFTAQSRAFVFMSQRQMLFYAQNEPEGIMTNKAINLIYSPSREQYINQRGAL